MLEYIIKSILFKIGYDTIKGLLSTENSSLNDKMRNAIDKAIEKFRTKYQNQYGAVSDNFLANQINFDKFINSIDFDTPMLQADDVSPEGFGNVGNAPPVLVDDFINMLKGEIKDDAQLHFLLSIKDLNEILKEIRDSLKQKITKHKFIDSHKYFENHDTHLLNIPADEIDRFKTYINSIRTFLESDENILLISGKGGNGKTHLLSELQNIVEVTDYELKFIQPDIREFKEAIQDEISEERKYLFVFDDAERYIEEIPYITAYVYSNPINNKLIFSFRPSGKNSIDKVIYDYKMEVVSSIISIDDWGTDELMQIFDFLEIKIDPDEKRHLAEIFPNPYIITWVGKLYKGEKNITIEKIKERFIAEIKREVEAELEKEIIDPLKFLVDICIIVPFYFNDTNLLSILSSRHKTEKANIVRVINYLIEIGVLRRIGDSVRYNPDMRGDLLLYYHLENNDDIKSITQLFEYWINISPEKVFINIQALSRYFKSTPLIDLCSILVNSWIDEAENTTGYERIEKLKLLSYISHLIPEESLNLVNTYLVIPSKPPIQETFYKVSPSSDDYGPILISLMWLPKYRLPILFTIEKVAHDRQGSYSNYKYCDLIKSLVSPLNHLPVYSLPILDEIEKWIKKLDGIKKELLRCALSEILASAHEVFKSYTRLFKIWEQAVPYSEDVIKLRRKAIDILNQLMMPEDEESFLLGIQVCQSIGDSKLRKVDLDKLPLKEEIEKEHEIMVEYIGSKIKELKSWKVIQEVEDLFLHWFAAEISGTKMVEKYLLEIPRSTEYLVFKFFVEPNYVILDFNEVLDNAPSTGKWDWMFKNYFFKFKDFNDPVFKSLASELNKKYTTKEIIVEYLNSLDKKITPYSPWNHPLIITNWIKLNKSTFISIKQDNPLWEKLTNRFKHEIELEFSRQDPKNVEILMEEFLTTTPNDIPKLKTILSTLHFIKTNEENLVVWIEKIIQLNNYDIIFELSYNLYFIFKNYDLYEKLAVLCTNILSPFDNQKINLLSRLSFTFELVLKNDSSISEDKLKNLSILCKEYLKNIPHFDNFHEPILFLTFKNRVKDFVEFLIYRYEKETENYHDFHSVPQGGFHKLNLLITNYDDFITLMDGVDKITEEISHGGIRLTDLNHNVQQLHNPDTGEQFVLEHIKKCHADKKLSKCLKYCPFIDNKEKNIDFIFNLAEESIKMGLSDNVNSMYQRLFSLTTFGWGNEELQKSKKYFLQLKAKVSPGLHHKIISDQLKDIERRSDWFNRDDDLTPRG